VDVFQEAEMLRKVPFFGGLDPAKLKLLAFTSDALRFGPGETLVRKGDLSDTAYVILEGDAEALGETRAGEFVLAVLGPNSLIGEMGVIQSVPRGATVRAKTAVRALRISADVFLRLISENPGCALDVMRQLCGRVAAANTRMATAQRDLESLRQQLQTAQAAPGGGTPA
jgi:CRP-like cAMP-binding protein